MDRNSLDEPSDRLLIVGPNGFSSEQLRTVFEICKPKSIEQCRMLEQRIGSILDDYEMFTEFKQQNGPLGEHRQRLKSIANLAMHLRDLLQVEPLSYLFLMKLVKSDHLGEKIQTSTRHQEKLGDALLEISRVSSKLATDNMQLRTHRVELFHPERSLERLHIWEPLFEVWEKLGRRVGFSANGPLIRLIRIFHEVLEIEPPPQDSVRTAINEHKKGGSPRRKTKPSAP